MSNHADYTCAMPLTCNIDARGKAVRLVYGILLVLAGFALVYWLAWNSASVLRWFLAISCIVGGAFAIFEARAGWCVMRAMGFKTPL